MRRGPASAERGTYAANLFNAAGRPDLTQKWVRWILETKYGDRENGLDGNDDGTPLNRHWFRHEEIARGNTLRLEMGLKPAP